MATAPHPDNPRTCNIMLSAAGRRVALMRLLQSNLADLGVGGEVVATDISPATAAMQVATINSRCTLPPYRDPACLEAILALVRERGISLIVPTIDPELPFYAQNRDRFTRVRCAVNVSSPEVIAIGSDKMLTHSWLLEHDLPTVAQSTLADALGGRDVSYPAIVKPRFGSASIGVSMARGAKDLEARAGEAELVVQSRAAGREYTVDVFVDSNGECRCAVPRLRLEVRSGEVSKGVTVRNGRIIELARRAVQSLPGAYGVMNIQLFHDEQTGRSQIIELNPRFGGGYPLTHEAGAPMARWLIEDVLDLPSTARDDTWREGVVMLRYDDAVFVDAAQAGVDLPKDRQ